MAAVDTPFRPNFSLVNIHTLFEFRVGVRRPRPSRPSRPHPCRLGNGPPSPVPTLHPPSLPPRPSVYGKNYLNSSDQSTLWTNR